MQYLGMWGVPIVGEVNPDGSVTYDLQYAAAMAKKPELKSPEIPKRHPLDRHCRTCGNIFRLRSKKSPFIVCNSCLNKT